MREQGLLSAWPLTNQIVAVAVGLVDGEARADLDYGEDFDCDVDLNLVFTGTGKLVEVQGTAEGAAFTREELNAMLDTGWTAARQIMAKQLEVVGPRLEALGLAMP
jgi:ribonuclease PH